MNRITAQLIAIVTLALAPLAGVAHHPLAEVFERSSSITLTGTITRIDWGNPHVLLKLRVDGQGVVVEWLVEMDPPHVLVQRGWTTDSIAIGQVITVAGFSALDAAPRTEARTITLASGETLVASTDASWNWTRL